MKIEVSKFKEALNCVKPALASKEVIEQTASFAFVDGHVVTYNDEISIRCPIVDVGFSGVIKADELIKFISKAKEKELDIVVSENEINMKVGRAKTGFALNKEILLPLDEEIAEVGKWGKLPTDFVLACKFAVGCTSTDTSDPKLMCVHFSEKGSCEASDNNRLLVWNFTDKMPIKDTLIPYTSIREVIKITPTHVASGNGWVHFKNERGVVVSCRVFDEEYVDTNAILKLVKKLTPIEFPEGLIPILEKAEIFRQNQDSDSGATLQLKDGKLLVTAESETAWFKEPIMCDIDVDFTFSIAPYLLKDILKETREGSINENMLVFKNGAWTYITSVINYEN